MADLRTGAGKHFVMPESKEVPKKNKKAEQKLYNDNGMSKGHKTHLMAKDETIWATK